MQTVTTIGFDIAKSLFQVHGVAADNQVLIRRQLKRRQVKAFFQSCHHAWLASRRAPHLIIGRASCRHLAIVCG
jgi:transposase